VTHPTSLEDGPLAGPRVVESGQLIAGPSLNRVAA
jgi:crotonobetainyl-CoA:carnitine CoA-transferase CaiB-like acyl-CoA transferase